MKIITVPSWSPIPHPPFEWMAYDDDTYDGPGSAVGHGATETEAVEDLKNRLQDKYYASFPATLPPLVWCECGHISGQHGTQYPHPCATGGHAGCDKGCKAFKHAVGQPQPIVKAMDGAEELNGL